MISSKKIRYLFIFSLMTVFFCSMLFAEDVTKESDEFYYSYSKGDKYRVIANVDEDIYINKIYSHSASIVNRIAISVDEIRKDNAALLQGDFSTSILYNKSKSFVADKIYKSQYWQLPKGRYEIEDKYYMPTVRHIPSFPNEKIIIGSKWSMFGEERYDFSADFGIEKPYTVPLNVKYEYVSDEVIDGRKVAKITASYSVFYKPQNNDKNIALYPELISGFSEQNLYWDFERHSLSSYDEQFCFTFDLSDGQSIEYRGVGKAKVIEATLMDKKSIEEEVKEAVKDLKDVTVETNEKGVKITLENIQFEPDSSRFLPGEAEKIDKIADILSNISSRDILIEGHSALAGTKDERQALSVDRARAVSDILIKKGVRKPESITVIGYGAEKPIASNSTESGKAKNRRVEIIILEN